MINQRNIEACERATSKICKCPCQGQFHGQEHPKEWIEKIKREGPPPKPGDSLNLRIK